MIFFKTPFNVEREFLANFEKANLSHLIKREEKLTYKWAICPYAGTENIISHQFTTPKQALKGGTLTGWMALLCTVNPKPSIFPLIGIRCASRNNSTAGMSFNLCLQIQAPIL